MNEIGELASVPGANWEEEIGALTEIACRTKEGPAVLLVSRKDPKDARLQNSNFEMRNLSLRSSRSWREKV